MMQESGDALLPLASSAAQHDTGAVLGPLASSSPRFLVAKLYLRCTHIPHPRRLWQPTGSAPGIKKFPFLKKKPKSQQSPRCLLKAVFKLVAPGPRGQPCAAAAP